MRLAIPVGVILVCISLPMMICAQKPLSNDGPRFPVQRGYVFKAPLMNFAPTRLENTFIELRDNKVDLAIPGLRSELQAHPDDLAAYCGLAQVDAVWRRQQFLIVEAEPKQNTDDSASRFKLATVLFYDWKLTSRLTSYTGAADQLARALSFASAAWKAKHEPIYGIILLDISMYSSRIDATNGVLEALVKQLAGPAAYDLFVRAKAHGWLDAAPDARLTIEANRRELDGVLQAEWSQYSARTGHVEKDRNGTNVIVSDPQDPAQQHRSEYVDRWIKKLRQQQ